MKILFDRFNLTEFRHHVARYYIYIILITSTNGYAQNHIEFSGLIDAAIPRVSNNTSVMNDLPTHSISLIKIKLSSKMHSIIKKKIALRARDAFQGGLGNIENIESKSSYISPLLNDVPVLDQGKHGTCVTFALTTAIDALLKRGNYISQLCSLELGSYLHEVSYKSSGWDGDYFNNIFSQLSYFGIVNSDNQRAGHCAGVSTYDPLNEENIGKPLSILDYKTYSENISSMIYMTPIQDFFEINEKVPLLFDDTEIVNRQNRMLETIKKSLNHGEIVVIGSLLRLTGTVGASGSFKAPFDTFMLPANDDDYTIVAFHAMTVYGYDDNAYVLDENGHPQKGLFYIRNSFGEQAGDHGTYYMTYDNLKMLVVAAYRIGMYLDDNSV